MKTTFRFALMAAAAGLLPAASMAEVDCIKLAVTVKNSAAEKPSDVLKLVEAQVSANPSCACEVVKAAILGVKADAEVVAAIVETASRIAPDKMRLVAQCAVAVAPDSLSSVQAVMARLDPNKGEGTSSAKDAKAAIAPKVASAFNPLDFPGQSPGQDPVNIGTTPGGPPPLPPGLPPSVPPVVNPPAGTDSDFAF